MSSLTRITTDQAIAVLLEEASLNPALVAKKLAEAAKRDQNGMKALLNAAGVEVLGDVAASAAHKIGKKTPSGIVPVGRYDIGEGMECTISQIPVQLRDLIGGIYAYDETVKKTAGLRLPRGRVCFAANSNTYYNDVRAYLRQHMRDNKENPNPESKAFIAWHKPIEDMVKHKIKNGDASDFLLPESRGLHGADIVQSCEPHPDTPCYMSVVNGEHGTTTFSPRDEIFRFGGSLFVATP